MTEKMIGIWVPEDIWKEIKSISMKENKPIKTIGLELFKTFIKHHGDGNPAFTLDQFNDPNMRAIPATMRPLADWQHFIDIMTEKDYRELEPQIQALYFKMKARWEKGF